MADEGFGSALWRNLQAVSIDRDGTLRAPVEVTPEDGVRIGVNAVAQPHATPRARKPGWCTRLLRRR